MMQTPNQKKENEKKYFPDSVTTVLFESEDLSKKRLESMKLDDIEEYPHTLLRDSNQEEFNRLLEYPGMDHLKLELIDGDIILTEFKNSVIHERASRSIVSLITCYNIDASGNEFSPLQCCGTTNIKLSSNSILLADESFQVDHRDCINLIVEIAISQSFPNVIQKARRYITETNNIMAVLIIKIYESLAMIGVLAVRDENGISFTQAISFGNAFLTPTRYTSVFNTIGIVPTGYCSDQDQPCSQVGLEKYIITIPKRHILCQDYVGNFIELEHQGFSDLKIDLFKVKYSIRDFIYEADFGVEED